jgi:hypothetical protein
MTSCPEGEHELQPRFDALTASPIPTIFRAMSPKVRGKHATATATRPSLRFSPINGILLAAGVAAIVLGYVLLSKGSTVAAPLLLVLGYAILIPLGIIL